MNAVVAPTPVLMLASATGRPAYEWPCAASLSRMPTDYKTGNFFHVATFYLLFYLLRVGGKLTLNGETTEGVVSLLFAVVQVCS